MKTASVIEIKKELTHKSYEELAELCLRLSKFKKENKELLTYLLFESHDENGYIQSVKMYMDEEFAAINTASYFYIKKFARYSLKNETEVELLIYFCESLKHFKPSIKHNVTLMNIYERQLLLAKKTIATMHEDLQYDFNLKLEEL